MKGAKINLKAFKNNTDNLIVSIGAGNTQFPFIKALKEEGYAVAAFGKGRNDLKAIKLCDYFSEIDTSDSGEAIKWLKELGVNIVGAGSFAGGRAINTLHNINREFNLPTKVPSSLSVGMDKFEQQKLYEKYELTSIKTFSFKEVKNNLDSVNGIQEFIIKPSIGRGSAGVSKVNINELHKIIKDNDFLETDMIQELKDGEEYRTLIIIQDKEVKLLAPIKRESFNGTFLLGRLRYVSDQVIQIENFVNKMVKSLNLKDSIIKVDIIVNEESVNIIEMDIGVGGGIYFKTYVSHLFDYDITTEYINLIIGKEVSRAKKNGKKIVMDYVYNLSGEPIIYDEYLCKKSLKDLLDSKEIIIVPNLLYPGRKGKIDTNADFIFCVIHDNDTYNNLDLNKFVNEKLFSKIEV